MSLPDQKNREFLSDFDIIQPWSRGSLTPGMTGVIRARNEAQSLPWVLPPLLRTLDEVILVDNLSDDGTADVARHVAADSGLVDKLRVVEYPFEVSRCGPEHLGTPADSVHSLTWFYEWSFSLVQTSYSLKWDGDMVLTSGGEAALGELAWQIPGNEVILNVPRQSLYIENESRAYLDLEWANAEPFGYPMSPDFRHVKAFEWELRLFPEGTDRIRLPEATCVELKWLDSDEFSHWTSPQAFAKSARSARKRREWQLVKDLRAGRLDSHAGIEVIEAPPGEHVINYVAHEWLPRATPELFRNRRAR